MKCIGRSTRLCKLLLADSPDWTRNLAFSTVQKTMSSRAGVVESDQDVLLETKGNEKGVITLNKPKNLNSLTVPMIRTIYKQLLEWQSKVSFVIVRSNSDKAFCAGGDVVDVAEAGKRGEKMATDFFYEEYQMNYLIGTYKIPQVALMHGITMGGGVGISVHGKYRVVTEKTLFAMPETKIGLIPDIGGTYFLPRIPRNLGIYLGLTGQRLVGYDVVRAGVATHFCDSNQLPDLQIELMNLKDASGLDGLLKKYTDASVHAKSQESYLEPNMDKIERLFSDKTIEGIMAALERDGSEWALKQKTTLTRMSPTSLKLSMRMFNKSLELDLKASLIKEYNIVQNILKNKDFYEGIRALLVDKDNNPSWSPSRIEDTSESYIDTYFEKAAIQLKF